MLMPQCIRGPSLCLQRVADASVLGRAAKTHWTLLDQRSHRPPKGSAGFEVHDYDASDKRYIVELEELLL